VSQGCFYTKLDERKAEMLGKAAENENLRAGNRVKATSNKTGFMRSVKMGVFQISPVNFSEISDRGVNDAGWLEKKPSPFSEPVSRSNAKRKNSRKQWRKLIN
jgi:hypothetical protein